MNEDDLLFCPLGGSGEIGMNMNLFCCNGQWIMVDCGMTFADEWLPGVDLIFPDPGFIEDRRDDLLGLVLTHGHEDHIGAVPYLWTRLRCPIYATPFTMELVRGKLIEAGLIDAVELHEIEIGGSFALGPFGITYVPLAHSIIEGNALKIETPYGTLFHTGDWKLDDAPQIGIPSTPDELTKIGDAGVLAMIGDSTNVFNPHESGSEQSVKDALHDVVTGLKGRVVITTFASNAARLQTVAEVARRNGRKIVLFGRSMHRIVAAAQKTGYLKNWPETIPEDKARHLPRDQVLVLCTGAQGEPRAALSRMANGDHRHMSLAAGDTVIFSSRIIPGNERSLGRLINKLVLMDVDVLTERDAPVHVSGHPGRAELQKMYEWIRPKIAIPVHGEARHLRRHAEFADKMGVSHSLAPANGDIIRLAPGPLAIVDQAPSGRLVLDGKSLLPVDSDVIAMRRRMSMNGVVVIILMLDENGFLDSDAEVISLGIAGLAEDDPLMSDLLGVIDDAMAGLGRSARFIDRDVREAVRIASRRFLRRHTNKNPSVEVRVVRFEDELV